MIELFEKGANQIRPRARRGDVLDLFFLLMTDLEVCPGGQAAGALHAIKSARCGIYCVDKNGQRAGGESHEHRAATGPCCPEWTGGNLIGVSFDPRTILKRRRGYSHHEVQCYNIFSLGHPDA